MIFHSLSHFDSSFKERFSDIFSALNERIAQDVPGDYPIRGTEIFIKILHYDTKSSDFITESHLEYVDLQIVYDGQEIIRVFETEDLEVKTPYRSDSDCQFYSIRNTSPIAVLTLTPGKAALFFPHDAHETQIAVDLIPRTIKKAVVKIHVKFFA